MDVAQLLSSRFASWLMLSFTNDLYLCSLVKSSDLASSAVSFMLILEAISIRFNSKAHCKLGYSPYFNNMLKGNLPSSSVLPVKVDLLLILWGVWFDHWAQMCLRRLNESVRNMNRRERKEDAFLGIVPLGMFTQFTMILLIILQSIRKLPREPSSRSAYPRSFAA